MTEDGSINLSGQPITQADVDAFNARMAVARLAEEKAIYDELLAWLKERGAAIAVAIQPVDGGAAAVPVWGVRKVTN